MTAPPTAKPQPKTFPHAIARASLASSQSLHQQHTDSGEDPLATALEKYALAMERVGEARLAQDAQIQSRFLAGWNTTLNTNLMFATRARKEVEKSRLTLDAVKARVKGTTWKLPGSPQATTHEQAELSHEAQEEIEKAEDEFVTHTEEAVNVMKNVGSPLWYITQRRPADTCGRSSTPLSLCVIWPSCSWRRPSSTRRLTISSASLHPSSRVFRSSKRQVVHRRLRCESLSR